MATATRDFTDHEIVVGKMRLHYLDWGNAGKPVVLCLHGCGQTAHSWDEFSRAMRGDHHVIALDQRGHGDSDWSKSGIYTPTAMAQDAHRVVNALGLRDITLVGLSMGGRNSIVYAAQHPERLKRLVVVDIGPEMMKKGADNIRRFTKADVLPTFDAFVERAHQFNPRRPLEQLRERLHWNLRQLPDGQWTWKYDRLRGTGERVDLWPYVHRIRTPMLLVRGAESDILSASAAKKFANAVPGSRLLTIEGAGHTVNGDRPEAFNAAVREWLGLT